MDVHDSVGYLSRFQSCVSSNKRDYEQERLLPSKESLYLTCPTVVFFIESEKSFEFVHQICVNFEPYLTYLRDSYVIYYLNSSRPIL